MMESCATCRYWRGKPSMEVSGIGSCRRFPPVILVESPLPVTEKSQICAIYPTQPGTEWCGEYRRAVATEQE
jgi:hypothetical protein